ncbi:Pepco domain-containing protein [Streptomyces sp. NPDC004457]
MESYDGRSAGDAQELEFLVLDEESDGRGAYDKSGGGLRGGRSDDGPRLRRRSFRPADLNAQLARTLAGLRDAFEGLQQAGPDGWGISQVQVSCQLTTSGQLVVMGVGGQAQRMGGIQLTLIPNPTGGDR